MHRAGGIWVHAPDGKQQASVGTQSQQTVIVPSGGTGCDVVCTHTWPAGQLVEHLNFVGVAIRIVAVVDPERPPRRLPGALDPTKSIR